MKFQEALKGFYKYSSVHHSEGTKVYYRSRERTLIENFGKYEVGMISSNQILDYIIRERERNPNISNATINKAIAALKFILKNQCNISLEYKKLPEIEKVIPTLSINTINLIFRYYEITTKSPSNQRNNIMFRLLLDTGLRINELVNLKISDFDFDTNTIHVKTTKTNSERYTFFRSDTHIQVTKYIIAQNIKDYVFIDFKTKEKLKVAHVETICSRLRQNLNLSISISPHKWRHTFATNFLKQNKDIEVLRLILGHRKLTTTQKYLHLDKDYLHEIYFKK